ncbi:MAG: ATP-dependent DNA helicase RecG [Lachnospiraceae bacterium]
MQINSSILEIKGIGEKSAAVFAKAGIYTVEDLLHYYPRDYEKFDPPVAFEKLEEEKVQAVAAFITKQPGVRRGDRKQIMTAVVREGDIQLNLFWFHMPFLKNVLKRGYLYIFRGRVVNKNGQLCMEQPKIYSSSEYQQLVGRLMPVYPLVAGLTNKMIRKAVKQVLEQAELIGEDLPEKMRQKYHLADAGSAMSAIHYPTDRETLICARRRIVFEEFYRFICQVRAMKEHMVQLPNNYPFLPAKSVEHLIKSLPYELTGAQRKVWEEISADLQGSTPMSRLVQGDVGCGKTIIAFMAMLTAAENGCQSAMMAPTEVLATQHYEGILALKEAYGLECEVLLLVGSMTAREKRIAYEKISMGTTDLVIGTHALIQEKVNFFNLGLVITDEQHRFGVCQRQVFCDKGYSPHILVMSATPIPRTLAMIVYGDLDISVIDEMPSNRIPVKNCVVDESYRPNAYRFIKKEVLAGHQVYIVCPMVEENEELELENVLDYSEKLKLEFPDIQICALHGKMKAAQKNEIMDAFSKNEIQILVSTTVIEVGINVPNATVMMVENAERFGLSQLHQLRGRVGRGSAQSYCIFMSNSKAEETKRRLEILNQSNDGFYVAEQDLKLRGPGDLFGIRQSGDLAFALGDIFTDAAILQEACEAVDIFGTIDYHHNLKVNL